MEDFTQYLNTDGTYTSPKNNKIYSNLKAFKSHWFYAGHVTGKTFADRLYNVKCSHCENEVIVSNIKKHESSCYLNPKNLRVCEVCNSPIKDYRKSKGTCSHSCSNKLFKHLRNKPTKYKNYATICWYYHKKECIVCKEDKIVAVHHYNKDHNDNRPENLVPLCPTHHQYVHSKYKCDVIEIINDYVKNFNLRVA